MLFFKLLLYLIPVLILLLPILKIQMKGLLASLLLLLLISDTLCFGVQKQDLTLSDLITRKKTAYKTDIFGREVKVPLKQKGTGISDSQQTLVLNFMKQAATIYSEDLVSNAKFIGNKIEDSLSGKWNVEIFGDDPSWGRYTHISRDKWLLFFAWGDFQLDYIIWAPDC